MPKTYKKPLERSISLGCLVFIVLLGFVLSVVNYNAYKAGLYRRYEAHIRDILNFTRSQIDADDLAKCLKSKYKSAKYRALQEFIDTFKDNADIHYLYLIRPLHDGPVDNVMDVIAAMSSYEKEYMPEMEVKLGGLTGEGYSVESVRNYLRAAENKDITFFTAPWVKDGVTYIDYTGTLPVYTSNGDYLGLLCVDIDITEIQKVVRNSTVVNVILILLLGFAFVFLFILWSHFNIAKPIQKLENKVTDFAYRHKGKENVDSIVIENPNIHTANEVESLANAVVKMSEDMRAYVLNVIEAESKARMLSELASKDALTNVRNKTSYDRYVEDLDRQISAGKAEFAVAMIDLNRLKAMNDTYGHERGNEYIKASCNVICHIFKHSPVFRIGGDEFVAILKDEDYRNRETLLREFMDFFKASAENKNAEPWQRLSAAIGMADFSPATDKKSSDTFNRADQIMYKNKVEMKANRTN